MWYALNAEEFGLVVLSIVLLYYVAVAIYYRKDIAEAFRTRARDRPESIMGPAKMDETGQQLVGAANLHFAPNDQTKSLVLGSLSDLMQELKTLVGLTIESGDTKETFLMLFQVLLGNHADLLDGSFNEAIIAYLLEQELPFILTTEELETILNNANQDETDQ